MDSKRRDETINLYAALMQEAKIRIEWIDAALNNRLGLNGQVTKEFCYLHLRMLCEIIALGCLVAHGDIQQTLSNKFRGEHSAEKIIKMLGDLHADFYPVPIKEGPGTGIAKIGYLEYDKSYLTKEELNALYWKCGEMLHKGNLKKLLSRKMPTQTSFPEISAIGQKVANLLSLHRILLSDKKTVIVCALDGGAPDNSARVFIGEAVEPQ